MPLFTYHCRDCDAAFEVLSSSSRKSRVGCKSCGGVSQRSDVSLFRTVGQVRSGTRPGRTGAEFVANPDSFVSAMTDFGEKIGDRLTGRQMEKAVEGIKQMKR